MNKTQRTKHRWVDGAIVYQAYPRSFYDSNADGIGDIPGVTAKLNYLKTLGVNAIWLSPFYPSPMADFGYDVADYCGVDPIFGSLADMDKLLKQAHKRNIKIMVDLVPNHTSDEHTWFHQSRQSRENPYADWYIWRDPKGHDKNGNPTPPNNWLAMFDGESAWEWEPARQQFYLHTFDVGQPDLNWTNSEVREGVKDAMRFWLDKGIDGFRVDAVPFMAKEPKLKDEPKNPDWKPGWHGYDRLKHVNNQGWPHLFDYLSEMAAVLKEPKYAAHDRFMVTEAYPSWHNKISDYMAYYKGMDPEVAAPFNFEGIGLPWQASEWHDFLKAFHKSLDDFSPLCVASYAFGNHDQSRLVTRIGESAARSAAVLLMTLPGMAFIYNGDELGMKNGIIPPDMVQDPGAVSSEGRDPERTPMQWTPGKNAGFSKADKTWLPIADNYKTHNVRSESWNRQSFLNLYKKLGKLRNTSATLKHGDFKIIPTKHKDVLGYTRSYDKVTHTVLVNFSDKPATAKLTDKPGRFVLSSFASSKPTVIDSTVKLAAHEAVIYEL
ncbi:alpha-glucosidase C-terminal domain-containing protein [Candidatus Saccharibacteria bacterium]|nr:alpha-glucosidase C-terminal domain-containing protein [Candidatus Saccharibacteria bacterium]